MQTRDSDLQMFNLTNVSLDVKNYCISNTINAPLIHIWDEMINKYVELNIYDMLLPVIRDFLSIQN